MSYSPSDSHEHCLPTIPTGFEGLFDLLANRRRRVAIRTVADRPPTPVTAAELARAVTDQLRAHPEETPPQEHAVHVALLQHHLEPLIDHGILVTESDAYRPGPAADPLATLLSAIQDACREGQP